MAIRVLMTGGTGFIGSQLVTRWLGRGYELVILTRQPAQTLKRWPQVTAISDLADTSGSFDGLVNLAGAGIADQRWSDARRAVLWQSRIGLTEQLAAWAQAADHHFDWVLSGSAVGYYGGHQGDHSAFTEHSAPGYDYPASLCVEWERAAATLAHNCNRLLTLRTGIVLGDGGMLKRLLMPFRFGLGSTLGDGQQLLSWIQLSDYCNAVDFLIQSTLTGPVNMVAPEPKSNREFSESLAKALSRPMFLNAPAWLLKILLGEMSGLLLEGQKVKPEVLTSAGFSYEYPQLAQALHKSLAS